MKSILEIWGWEVIAEDEWNWVIAEAKKDKGEPIILPKQGRVLALDVMMQTLIDTKLDLYNYFLIKEKVLGPADLGAGPKKLA
jgi:hypothetical protein